MKKVLKITAITLLVVLLLAIIFLLIVFIYNKVKLKDEDDILKNYPGELVEVDGHKMNVYVDGKGEHTLVFLAPSLDVSPMITFKPLYSQLKNDYRTVVVEKFGYGMSDEVDTERDYKTMVDECREALEKSGVKAPYILCPYSKSGIDTLIWAQEYPDEVEAIISIDMAFPEHYDEMKIDVSAMKKTSKLMGIARKTGILRLFLSDSDFSEKHSKEDIEMERALVCRKYMNKTIAYYELNTLSDACEMIKSRPKPDVPMQLFITNGVEEIDKEKWQEIVHSYVDELKDTSFTYLDCGHYDIIEDESEQIIKDIKKFIKHMN